MTFLLINKGGNETIIIKKSETADTRTCDFSQVSKEQLLSSSVQHISDVAKGITFFLIMLQGAASEHDRDKITAIDQFHKDFITGFKETPWWDLHRTLTRHHLTEKDGVPLDVNLIDVLEMIVDYVMAGMGRSGKVIPLTIELDLLKVAFDNTWKLLESNILVDAQKAVSK